MGRVISLLVFWAALAACSAQPRYTGFRPHAPVAGACEMSLSAGALCGNYSASESLKSDLQVARAKQFCEEFYRSALRAADLLCAYSKDLDGIMDDGEGKDSATVSARVKQLHGRYEARAFRLRKSLEHAYRNEGAGGTMKALEELEAEAHEHVLRELGCGAPALPNAAPGLLKIGLVRQSKADQTRTFEELREKLGRFGGEMMLLEERPMKKLHALLGSGVRSGEKKLVPTFVQGKSVGAVELAQLGRRQYPEGRALDLYLARTQQRTNENSSAVAMEKATGGRGLASVSCPGKRATP